MTHRDPRLDLAALLALRQPRHNPRQIVDRIADHLHRHDGYLAFSGGKDSLAALHLALTADPNLPVAFFDGGLEYPETYQYLEQLQSRWNLNLDVIPTQPSTLQVLAASGHWDHTAAASPTRQPTLRDIGITTPAATAHTSHGPGELWGVRADESRGRTALYGRALHTETGRACHGCCTTSSQQRARHGGVVRRQDGTIAYGPVWNWRTDDIWAYLHHHQVPINPVYAKLRAVGAPPHAHRLSQMLDGEHLENGRATWLRRGWPHIFEDLCTVLPRLREFV